MGLEGEPLAPMETDEPSASDPKAKAKITPAMAARIKQIKPLLSGEEGAKKWGGGGQKWVRGPKKWGGGPKNGLGGGVQKWGGGAQKWGGRLKKQGGGL